LEWAGKSYDIVLIDTPSVSVGADAMLVASKTGAAIVVARANETKLSAYTEMLDGLKRSNIKIVGAVLNNPPLIDVAH